MIIKVKGLLFADYEEVTESIISQLLSKHLVILY